MPESSAAMPAPHSTPGDATVLYTEKLWPNFWIWLVAAGLSGAGILVFAPISLGAGLTAAVVLFVIISVLLVLSTPAITVTGSTLSVGRATIERRYVGAASAFRGPEATAERGTRLNGLAFLCIRGWIDPVVRIEITDPSDRTPYWLTSTRRPDDLLAALNS
jgi:membrane protein implicated in regulation of membrane protease activity